MTFSLSSGQRWASEANRKSVLEGQFPMLHGSITYCINMARMGW